MPAPSPASPHPGGRRVPAVVALGAVAVQLLVLYLPRTPEVPGTDVPGGDLLVHAAVFAVVTAALLWASVPVRAVVAYGVVQAAVSEVIHHALLPGRSGEITDVAADLVGVAVGVAAVRWTRSRGRVHGARGEVSPRARR